MQWPKIEGRLLVDLSASEEQISVTECGAHWKTQDGVAIRGMTIPVTEYSPLIIRVQSLWMCPARTAFTCAERSEGSATLASRRSKATTPVSVKESGVAWVGGWWTQTRAGRPGCASSCHKHAQATA